MDRANIFSPFFPFFVCFLYLRFSPPFYSTAFFNARGLIYAVLLVTAVLLIDCIVKLLVISMTDVVNANVGTHVGILLNARSSWIFFFFGQIFDVVRLMRD